ncbi:MULTISPECIES: chaplin [unclassified Streptomyces]|uniref:chaplin n=1 Tax=unclassified Streptomyces TaxID=2593676 RepID=UPI0029666B60|nr:chaplin [Streptomyces sp. SCL15-4]
MRLRSLATTTVITAALALAGTATAVASDGGGPTTVGVAANSPGVLSGNVIQVPINVQANVCGNSINIIGLLNPAFGNACANK